MQKNAKLEFLNDALTCAGGSGCSYWGDIDYREDKNYADMLDTPVYELTIKPYDEPDAEYRVTVDTIERGFDLAVEMFRKRGQNNSNRYRWDDCLNWSSAKAMNDWDIATYDSEMADIVVQMALFGELRYS